MSPQAFEFYPIQLAQWVNLHCRKSQADQLSARREIRTHNRLQRLREQYRQLPQGDHNAFLHWVQQLSNRERELLPSLYAILHAEGMAPAERSRLVEAILRYTHTLWRLFYRILEALYMTCDLENLWHPLRQVYAVHIQRLERRLEEADRKLWRDFLLSRDQVGYLAMVAYNSEEGVEQALQRFRLGSHMPFFKLVFLEMIKKAEESFYQREKELFKTFFEKGTNREQQQMAENLIRHCRLNHVRELGLLIYEKMGTYKVKPMLWSEVGEKEKIRFAQWVLRNQLKNFFIGVNQESERFQYWRKFIPNMEDVVVIDRNRTMIMYFGDVVIMEVIGTGAVYVYDRQTFQTYFQPKVDRFLERKRLHNENQWIFYEDLKREQLMDKDKVYKNGWLVHSGDWQHKFDFWLRTQLGWEVDERVLAAKIIQDDADGTDSV